MYYEVNCNIKKKFLYWRKKIILTNFISYIMYYFTRKSFIFIIPALSENLKFTNSLIGLLSTILYISYGISKVVNSFLADFINPRYFITIGLFLSGTFNICIIYCTTTTALIIFCCLNGWFQGIGWPILTKQLTHLFIQKERSIWWSICSTSHTIGGAFAAIICTHASNLFNWHAALYIPSLISLCFSIFIIKYLKKTPNLTITNFYKKNYKTKKKILQKNNRIQLFNKQILFNKLMWLFSISYFLLYILKTAINDWIILFFIEQKNYTLITAGICIFSFEIGGLFGILITGFLSNIILKNKELLILYYVVLLYFLYLLNAQEIKTSLLHTLILFFIGFTIFSPQMLIGLLVTELTNKKIACAANGFISGWAYLGASFSGYPLGLLIDKSWDIFFFSLIICSITSIFLTIYILFYIKK